MNSLISAMSCVVLQAECTEDFKDIWIDGRHYSGHDDIVKTITIGHTVFKYYSCNKDEFTTAARLGCSVYKYTYRRQLHSHSVNDCKMVVHNFISDQYGQAIAAKVVNKYAELIQQQTEILMSARCIAVLIRDKVEHELQGIFK